MAREIERKFLVAGERWRTQATRGIDYQQGYLSLDAQRSVRVRIARDEARLNIKGKISMLSRYEFEYPIPIADARELLDRLCIRPIIEKTRYRLTHAGLDWEIDVFRGDNSGLVIAEIELESEAQHFERPEWLGEEVSHDPRYLNINLVKCPYTRW